MCSKYKVCGKRHLPKWKVSKIRRDKKGRFIESPRTLTKIFLGVTFLLATYMIGWNTIINSIGLAVQVDNSQAEVVWHQPTIEDEVRSMLREAGIDVEAAIKIAKYESWFQEKNFYVNTKGEYAGTVDRGLWMLNDHFHAEISDDCAYDGICSTIQAIRIMKTRGFNEWTCYKKNLCR